MASLTIRPEPVKQKKRPNYQINNNRYCTYCASNRDHQWPFELSRRPLGKTEASKVRPASRSAVKVSSNNSHAPPLLHWETKVRWFEPNSDSRTLKADATSDHLFAQLADALDPPSI
ncbi:hypothetical protein F2Q68_00032136 [Brassica cretica]|uniref:Uncharacterized protein n=1 Tax=Brassica cretica TaxID=69181 RepID=A0A8S9GHF2_BRACR|nr:hypothetical protein F2Q68_00032136 [Brassica cretica]